MEIGSLTARLIKDAPILSVPIAEDFCGADLARCPDARNYPHKHVKDTRGTVPKRTAESLVIKLYQCPGEE